MSAESPPVLVLGMHRSGTSYLANLVQALGVRLGEQLIGPQRGNPRGHFEDREILLFHENALDARQPKTGRVFDPGMMATAPVDGRFSAEEATAARALVAARSGQGPWGWKEPRTALFLEGWEAIAPDLRGIVIYRHPWAVHDSMRRRGHWDLFFYPAQVLEAYATYNEAILRAMEANRDRFLVLEAEAALADPAVLVERLGAFLDLPTTGVEVPEFHREEFAPPPSTPFSEAALRWTVPRAAEAYGALQHHADLPAVGNSDTSELVPDDTAARVWTGLQESLAQWPVAARGLVLPAVEALVFDRDPESVVDELSALATDLRVALEQEGGWDAKAKRIFEDNRRLQDELERIGAEFTAQQAFLKQQTADFDRIWNELQSVGKSWEAQRDYIRNMEQRWGAAQAAEETKQ